MISHPTIRSNGPADALIMWREGVFVCRMLIRREGKKRGESVEGRQESLETGHWYLSVELTGMYGTVTLGRHVCACPAPFYPSDPAHVPIAHCNA
jgi:hypothetical protein